MITTITTTLNRHPAGGQQERHGELSAPPSSTLRPALPPPETANPLHGQVADPDPDLPPNRTPARPTRTDDGYRLDGRQLAAGDRLLLHLADGSETSPSAGSLTARR